MNHYKTIIGHYMNLYKTIGHNMNHYKTVANAVSKPVLIFGFV